MKENAVKIAISTAVGAVCSYLEELIVPVIVLCCVMILDYCSGMVKAWIKGNVSSKLGVKGIEYRTGNSYTRMQTAKGGYPLSGELSGHIYFRDKWPGYDDGIYSGMRLIEMLSNSDRKLSSYLDNLEKYYSTPEIKVAVDDSKKFDIVNKIKEYCDSKNYTYSTIDGVKVKYPDGFALVRASNTGPNITMRFEAKTEERLNAINTEITE